MDILLASDKSNLTSEVVQNKPDSNIAKKVDLSNTAFLDLLFNSGDLQFGSDKILPFQVELRKTDNMGENGRQNNRKNDENSALTTSFESNNKDAYNVSNRNDGKPIDNNGGMHNEENGNTFNNKTYSTGTSENKSEVNKNEVRTSEVNKNEVNKNEVHTNDKPNVLNSKKTEKVETKNDVVSLKSDKDKELENIKDLKKLLLDKDLKEKNPELFAKLEIIVSVLESKEGKAVKPETIEELNSLLSKGVKLGKSIKGISPSNDHKRQELVAGLEKIASILEENGIKPETINEVKELLVNGALDQKHPDLIAKLEDALTSIGNKDVKAEVVKDIKEIVSSGIVDNKGKGSLAKLGEIISIIKEKNPKSEVVGKLKDMLSEEGVDNKGKELSDLIKNAMSELKGKEGEIKKGRNPDKDNAFVTTVLEKLEEHIGEKIVKNIDKNQALSDKFSNDLSSVKITDKGKESSDVSAKKSKTDVTSENELNVDARVSGDGNKSDSMKTDRGGRGDQRVVSQNMKNEQSGQNTHNNNSNKEKSSSLADKGKVKGESVKLELNDHDVQMGGGVKTQSAVKAGSAGQTSKMPSVLTVTPEQIKDMVVSGVKKFNNGGNSEIHLNITRPNLGNVKISFIENSNGKLEVRVLTERPEAAELIKQNSVDIKQLLSDEGIDLTKFDVFDSLDENKNSFAQNRSSFKRGRRRNSSGNNEEGDDDQTVGQGVVTDNQDVTGVDNDDQVNVLI